MKMGGLGDVHEASADGSQSSREASFVVVWLKGACLVKGVLTQ